MQAKAVLGIKNAERREDRYYGMPADVSEKLSDALKGCRTFSKKKVLGLLIPYRLFTSGK